MTLPRFSQEELDWENRKDWCVGLVKLNSSIDHANEMLNMSRRMETLERYREKGAEAAKDNKQRRENPNEEEEDIVEKENKKSDFYCRPEEVHISIRTSNNGTRISIKN